MADIRVWIVEDDPDWLRGLSGYLDSQPDLAVTFRAERPDAVREALAEGGADADVVLMDIMLQGVPAGIELAEEVSVATGARVIMLTSMEEKEFIFRSFQAGAIDYQIKSEYESLPGAIRAASARRAPISPEAAERMREEFRRLKKLEREFEVRKMRDLITPSELQLLELVDRGYSQSQIAERLVVSIRTVKNHINHVLKKLGLTGSKEAARIARDMGLFEREDGKGQG
ncbi:response regulator [Cohnella sp. CFH 77786]|uniref:response regulator n=1 Tax=Cohnella sp. CFH 77786 TaxID=2662265 RepID=UPI001C60E71A|nr:response regulator [Cohnella sp. CFH 77786]